MISENSNNKRNSDKNSGRKLGSRNKLTKESKEMLLEMFNQSFRQLNRLIHHVPIDERFVALKPYAKMLSTGGDETSEEFKALLFETLKPELIKLKFYIYQLPIDKRANQLRLYLQMLNPEQIKEVFNSMRR